MDRIRVTYVLTTANREDAHAKARDIGFEQTVELPPGTLPPGLEERIVGTVETVRDAGEEGRFEAVLSYDPIAVGDDLPQLLNLLYGNISLMSGIRLTGLELPPAVLGRLPGPRFGIEGVRRLCACDDERPLLCAAAKPVGLSAVELARLCHTLATSGIDLVKDDHGLANQASAPFDERVKQCQDAVERANARTGGHTLYVPNLTGPVDTLPDRLELVRSIGCRAVLLAPLLIGLDTVRWIAEGTVLSVFAHPALAGAYFHPHHGITPDVLLGTVFRAIGSDGVIYPNAGGRFPLTRRTCEAINRRLRAPLGGMRAAFPVPGGGVDAARVPYWTEQYGPDTVFLVGASLYAEPDLEQAARRLVESVRTVWA